jgi:hypothetical protein
MVDQWLMSPSWGNSILMTAEGKKPKKIKEGQSDNVAILTGGIWDSASS